MTWDHTCAECAVCPLNQSRIDSGVVLGQMPAGAFNNIMIVGEGPGANEIRQRLPFVGNSGKLLDSLLEYSGIRRDECYVTNATLCAPIKEVPGGVGKKKKTSFMDRFPLAPYACAPRLEAEIAAVAPRVIIALGQTALAALTGKDTDVAHRVPFTCEVCGNPPKRKKACPGCKGYKTKVEIEKRFATDQTISYVAGGVYRTETLSSRLDQLGVKYIIPTYHPSFLLHTAGGGYGEVTVGGQYVAAAVAAHFRKAKRLAVGDAVWSFKHTITTNEWDVIAYTQRTDSYYACDIETDAKDPHDVQTIKCIGIGRSDTDEVLVVDTRNADRALWQALRWFLEDGAKKKIWQNRFYDEQVLYLRQAIQVAGTDGDTMLMHHALFPDEPHTLNAIAFRYTDVPPWKPPKSKGGIEAFETFEELAHYNAIDVRTTGLVVEPMRAELAMENVEQIAKLDLKMVDLALEMQRTGLPISRPRQAQLATECKTLAAKAYAEMQFMLADVATDHVKAFLASCSDTAGTEEDEADDNAWLDKGFAPQSNPQLAWMLFDKAGPFKLPITVRTPTGLPSTNKDVLKKIQHPFVKALLSFRENHKLVSTFLEGKGDVIREDGCVHPAWKVHGARTGRWSSSPNWQNRPRKLRSIVAAPEGRRIVGADKAQLEMRLIAALSGDPDLVKRCIEAIEARKLEPDHDPHSYVASLAFKRAFTDCDPYDTKHDKFMAKEGLCKCGTCIRKLLREAVKRVVYGLNYGAGPHKILEVIYNGGWTGGPLTVEIINSLIRTYFAAFPRIPIWREEQLRKARESHEVRSAILGRRRIFPLGDIDSTVIYNFPIQSTGADIVNSELAILMDLLDAIDPTARFFAQVHDAVYILCNEDRAEDVATCVTNTMTTTRMIGDVEMPFPATAKIGVSWDAVS